MKIGGREISSEVIDIVVIIILFAVVLFFVAGPVYFTGFMVANDTMILDVNVSTVALIRILPISISWNETERVDPGSNGTIKNISIKNAGSINVSDFYATVDTLEKENVNPLGSGDASFYASGGLIFIRNETHDVYWHLGRIEWNLSEVLTMEDLDLDNGTVTYAHGWYRRASGNEYLWKLENGTNNTCNNTDTIFKIKLFPENADNFNRDLSTGTATGNAHVNSTEWTFFNFTSGPIEGYCVASYYDCSKIFIYKFDKSALFGNCGSSMYLTGQNLTPGERLHKIKLMPSIPEGFPGGDTNTSIMTIWASSI